MSGLDYAGEVSHGAWLTYQAIARSRPHRGGLRRVGRSRLASRVRRTVRQVGRYLAELRTAGYIEVTPPRRVLTPDGWRTLGVNCYRLLRSARDRAASRPRRHRGWHGRPDGWTPTPTPPSYTAPDPPAAAGRDRTYAAGLAAARAALRAGRTH
jgi:hypothetical protein